MLGPGSHPHGFCRGCPPWLEPFEELMLFCAIYSLGLQDQPRMSHLLENGPAIPFAMAQFVKTPKSTESSPCISDTALAQNLVGQAMMTARLDALPSII